MGLIGKIRDIMGVDDEDDFENEEMDFIGSRGAGRQAAPAEDYEGEKRNRVMNINATTRLQVVLVKPERFDDASAVADHLNARRTVVLNLDSTNKEVSRRLVDFLSGVAYANNGQIKRVAISTFIITPYNVDIAGDILDEIENNGVYF
jgi:cell division inhibitor SepF